MQEGKGKIYIIVPIMVLAAIFIAYFYGWSIGAHFNPDSTAYDMSEFTALVNEDIDSGKEKGVYYVTGVTEDEVISINDYICSINGVVSQYSILERSPKGFKVMLMYDISDNYYVLEKYLNGTSIPNDRPTAKKLYEQVVSIIDTIIEPEMTDYEKELAIHDYIVKNCEYGYVDESKEYAYRAYGCLVQKTAVCNGYAEAMTLLLSCTGVENRIITGTAGGELHAWNQVKLDGEWYHIDATWDDPVPDGGYYAGHMYFNVPDDIMDDSHTWEEDMFEECSSTDYNYYIFNDLDGNYNDFMNIIRDAASRDVTATVEVLVYDYDADNYDFEAIFDIQGVTHLWYSEVEWGDGDIITVYLNQTQ